MSSHTQEKRDTAAPNRQRSAVEEGSSGKPSRYHVDLRPYANRDYVDDVAGDGVGGWSDQGYANSIPAMPGGTLLHGTVSFDIIETARKNRVVALHKNDGSLPDSLTVEPIDYAAPYIHLMHAVASGTKDAVIATCSCVTAEGTEFSRQIVQGRDVANFWYPEETDSMKTVWFGANDDCPFIGINAVAIRNPYPDQRLTKLHIRMEHPEAILLLCAVTLSDRSLEAWPPTEVIPAYDRFGGYRQVFFDDHHSGFFGVRKKEGKCWFVDPLGNGFISKGVNSVQMLPSPRKDGTHPYTENVKESYRHKDDWAEKNVARLKGLHFNTAGSWCDDEVYARLPHNRILGCAHTAGFQWVKRDFFDVFSRDFTEGVDKLCREKCAPCKDDKLLIGYFSDNELNWAMGADARSYMIDYYLGQDSDAAGRNAVLDLLREKYGAIEKLNRAWGASYASFDQMTTPTWSDAPPQGYLDDNDLVIEAAARRYFSVCNNAIKKHDPNHLYLGCRLAFPNEHMEPVYRGMRGHVDVVTVNHYRMKPEPHRLGRIYEITGAPVMITEFSFVAMDSGLPNTKGASKPVGTQAQRSLLFDSYVSELMKTDYVIGYHWFQYIDQPHEGRGLDGENQNYGIVDHHDEMYGMLAETMRVVNGSAERLRLR